MSIVDLYKEQFQIVCFDEDLKRGERVHHFLEKQGFQIQTFNSRGLFLEGLKAGTLPHIIFLYYQPLNLQFRETLKAIGAASDEIEVVLLGSPDFWPGAHSLLQAGLVDDFWTWPFAGLELLQTRLERVVEKTVFKFIAEQRSTETQQIVSRIDELKLLSARTSNQSLIEEESQENWFSEGPKTEARLVEEAIDHLKRVFPENEFIYFKNYVAKNQLLATRTSFAAENYFRGQSVPFNQEHLAGQQGEVFNRLRDHISDSFSCENFVMQPVEFNGSLFGVLMAVEFDDLNFLKKTAHYLAVALRNESLESEAGSKTSLNSTFEREIGTKEFPYVLSTEVSRARRLNLPVSLLMGQIDFVGEQKEDFRKVYQLIKNELRSYDYICQLSENQVAVILPHCRYEDAAIKAETLRRKIVARGLKAQNTPLRLCFGVSDFPNLSIDSDSLRVDAKSACRQVMVSGKNKVCLYQNPEV